MNAHELTFGVEIETVVHDRVLQTDGLRIGPYRHGIQVPYLPDVLPGHVLSIEDEYTSVLTFNRGKLRLDALSLRG